MDVTLPNGTVIRGIPDGTNKWQIAEKAISKGLATPEDFGQESSTPLGTGYENFMAGAGKSVVDLGRGAKQLGAEALDKVSPRAPSVEQLISGQDPSRGGALRAQQDEIQARDAPLMGSGAGMAGNIAGNVAMMAVPGGVAARGAQAAGMTRGAGLLRALANPSTLKSAAGSGAAFGALAPVGTEDSRGLNTAAGAITGALGQGAAGLAGRIAQPIANVAGKGVDKLKEAGIPLDLAQRTGSQFLQRIKSGLSSNPVTASGQRATAQTQQRAYTAAVLKTVGADADAATSDVMGAAKSRIGKVFDDVAESNPIAYDDPLQKGLEELLDNAKKELNPGQLTVLNRQVDEVLDKAAAGNGHIDGGAFQNIKKSLDRVSGGPDTSLGFWARELRETLHDALERSAKPDDLARLKEARTQWGNLRTIEGAISKDGEGVISPLRLSNALSTKSNRWKSVYGGGDQTLVELAQAGRGVLPESLPDSGTAGRLLGAGLVSGGLGGGTYALTGGDTKSAALAAGLGVGGPKLAQYVLNRAPNKSRYLAEGLKSGLARTVLESPKKSAKVGAMTKQALLAALLSQNAQGNIQ